MRYGLKPSNGNIAKIYGLSHIHFKHCYDIWIKYFYYEQTFTTNIAIAMDIL